MENQGLQSTNQQDTLVEKLVQVNRVAKTVKGGRVMSWTRLKGPGRPVNNVARRMAVLAGLGAVDFVVPFGEDTPQSLIAEVLPDVLVKGGDYTIDEIAGGKEVLANGGEVKVMHFEEGVSTTAIIKQIVDTQ